MNQKTLLDWYDSHRRPLPWRDTRDAYRIWLSEIILQQTRVAQGMDYYLRFVERWPTVEALGAASEDEVLKEWQGLGYYSRARNLLKAARQVMERHRGVFPTQYADLIYLKGIGPYTAAAIASFAADEPVAVVDGNVYRVLSRLYDLDTPIDSTEGRKLFGDLAAQLLDRRRPGLHNQAMMELGALVCIPSSPRCGDCPMHDACMARANGTTADRPVKQGRAKVRDRWICYLVLKHGDTLWVRRRPGGDIWQGLWEFVNVETPSPIGTEETGSLIDTVLSPADRSAVESIVPMAEDMRHQLTHRLLHISCYLLNLSRVVHPTGEYQPILWSNWQEKAVPKPIFDLNNKIYPFFVP